MEADENPSVLPPEELEEVPTTENPKQQLSDTYITFIPKNSTGYTTKGHIVEVQIPRTEHVIALAKSFIELDLKLDLNHTDEHGYTGGAKLENGERLFVGIINSATIFDQTRILNNGKAIMTDTFCQVNSRMWQQNKPHLKDLYASFINIDDLTNNEGFTVREITSTRYTSNAIPANGNTFRLNIPLPCLFPCFDNANNFSTSLLTDDVTLSMRLSAPDRYLCIIITDADGKVKNIQPFDTDGNAIYRTVTAATGAKTSYSVHYNDGENNYKVLDNMRIVCPAHYPTETESAALTGLVDNEGVSYPFITCDIQEQKDSFSPVTDNANIDPASTPTTSTKNIAINYSSNVNNLFAVLMLFSHHHSYVCFDKPLMKDIECNLSELIKLANNKTHTGYNYTYKRDDEDETKTVPINSEASRGPIMDTDNDIYKDLVNALGADGFRNLSRYDEALRRDYQQKDSCNGNMLGSYMQYYPVACGQMLGVSSDYFAHQINFKCLTEWSCKRITPAGEGAETYATCTMGINNYKDASVFCCQLTFKRLMFVNGGLDIENPLSDNYDIRRHIRGEVSGNAHGILTSLIEPVTNLMKSAGNTIRNEIYRIKRNKNTTHAYTRLGKDGYEKHKDIIEANGTMGTRKFKKFIDNLIESEKQLSAPSHGVADPNALGGTASTSIGQATQEIETEKGVDIRLLNLNVYHQQSRNADFADRIGWKHQLIMDYKYHANVQKLRLSSWGVETAILGVSNAHGLGTWLKDKWGKVKTWWREKAKPWLKDQGSKLLSNAKDIAKQYASKILSGELKITDVPSKFIPTVRSIINNGDLTRGMDPQIQEAINIIRDIKAGKKTWQDVPADVYNLIKSKNLEASASGNGLVIRHGFYGKVNYRPSVSYGVIKRRMNMILDKNPNELKDKDLRAIYAYKRLRDRPLVDKHGTLGVTLRRLYGEPIYKRKLISENRLPAHGKPQNPFKTKLISEYFNGDKASYKKWKKSRKLPAPHEDIPPVNSPFMQQVDVNHGISEEEAYWKKHKKELKKKLLEKMKSKK